MNSLDMIYLDTGRQYSFGMMSSEERSTPGQSRFDLLQLKLVLPKRIDSVDRWPSIDLRSLYRKRRIANYFELVLDGVD